MALKSAGPRQVAGLLAGGSLGRLQSESRKRHSLADELRRTLPEEIAEHLVSATVREDGALVVCMDASVWAARVRYMAAQPGIRSRRREGHSTRSVKSVRRPTKSRLVPAKSRWLFLAAPAATSRLRVSPRARGISPCRGWSSSWRSEFSSSTMTVAKSPWRQRSRSDCGAQHPARPRLDHIDHRPDCGTPAQATIKAVPCGVGPSQRVRFPGWLSFNEFVMLL